MNVHLHKKLYIYIYFNNLTLLLYLSQIIDFKNVDYLLTSSLFLNQNKKNGCF